MSSDYLPRKDADLLAFATNMSTLITAQPTSYGLVAANALELADLLADFSTALTAATNPATRGGATILAKDNSRDVLVAYIRRLGRAVQGTLTVTDEQRYALGLNVPAPHTPIGAPTEPPVAEIVHRIGTMVRYRLHDGSGVRRGKPDGVQGARVYTFVGATPPIEIDGWNLQGQTTRTFVDIEFPVTTAPGTVVWFTAQWYNPTGETGPGCAPLSAIIAGGAMEQAA